MDDVPIRETKSKPGKAVAVLVGSVMVVLAAAFQASGNSAQASPSSACAQLGGTVGSDDFCEFNSTTTTYRITLRFPTGYPDQQAVADYLTNARTEFIDWVSAPATRARPNPFELDVIGKAYQSGDRQAGTQSLVLTIGNDTGVHPVTTYQAFNYSLANRAPVTFETLFKPDSDPLALLNPIVRRQVAIRDPKASAKADGLTAATYRQFAITDDAILFFFNQDGLLPHEDGPLQVTVPRDELASILA